MDLLKGSSSQPIRRLTPCLYVCT